MGYSAPSAQGDDQPQRDQHAINRQPIGTTI